MENQSLVAAAITARVREIAKGDVVFNESAIIEQRITKFPSKEDEKIIVTIPVKIGEPAIEFTSSISKYKDGIVDVTFTQCGTDDLNDFLEVLKTFE